MMPIVEVFFDYACPFCLRGHENLVKIHTQHLEIDIQWRPCEAHPRPETYGPHSDLCIRGLYYALDQGVDVWDYHQRMYRAALTDRLDIENIDVLRGIVEGLLDPNAFAAMLRSDAYIHELEEGNRYAYEQSGVWAVPAYRMDGRKLDAVENIGVTHAQLEAFLLQST